MHGVEIKMHKEVIIYRRKTMFSERELEETKKAGKESNFWS